MPRKTPINRKKSEDIGKALLQEVPFGVMLTGRKGKVLLLNAAFTGLTGYRTDDLPEWDAWVTKAFPDDEWRRRAQSARSRALKGEEEGGAMNRVVCRDGAVRDLHLQHAPLDNGRTLLILSSRTTDDCDMPLRGSTQPSGKENASAVSK